MKSTITLWTVTQASSPWSESMQLSPLCLSDYECIKRHLLLSRLFWNTQCGFKSGSDWSEVQERWVLWPESDDEFVSEASSDIHKNSIETVSMSSVSVLSCIVCERWITIKRLAYLPFKFKSFNLLLTKMCVPDDFIPFWQTACTFFLAVLAIVISNEYKRQNVMWVIERGHPSGTWVLLPKVVGLWCHSNNDRLLGRRDWMLSRLSPTLVLHLWPLGLRLPSWSR